MSVQFISASKLKEMSAIHGNVDDKLITHIITDCQDYYIEPIVGTALFNEIKSQIPTPTVLNKKLLDDYIIPCLVEYVKYEAVTELNIKFTNKNVSKKDSENSQPITQEEAIFLMDKIKNRAEYRAERVTKYLLENRNSYPLYILPGTGIDTVHPIGTNYECGILLDDSCNGSCDKNSCLCYIYK